MKKEELINYIKEVKKQTDKLEKNMDNKKKEENVLRQEADSKLDKTSGFYKDAKTKADEKHSEWTEAFAKREAYKKKADIEIEKAKSVIIKDLEEKAKWIDENRSVSPSDMYSKIKELNTTLYAKKQELKYFETTLPENEDKTKIINSKQHYIDVLDSDIKEKIAQAELLKDGKAEQNYNKIKSEIDFIKGLSVENIDKIVEEEKESPKKEEPTKSEEAVPKEEEPAKSEEAASTKKEEPAKPEEAAPKKEETAEQTSQGEMKFKNDGYVEYEEDKNGLGKRPKVQKVELENNNNVKIIKIDASTNKASVFYGPIEENDIDPNATRELYVDEAIEDRKEIYKSSMLKTVMKVNGVSSSIKQAMLKRKMNPIILKALEGNAEATDEYVKSVINKEAFPFEYEINLENSELPKKDFKVINKIALKEAQIEGNQVIGAKEKFHKLKDFFRNIKDKKGRLANKEVQQIGDGKERQPNKKQNGFKEDLQEQYKKLEEQRNKNMENAYEKLTDEQKENLPNLSVSDIQKLGIEYNTAFSLYEKYGKKEQQNSEKGTEQEQNTQGKAEDNAEKGAEH